jgi:phosphoribosylglycinamide formyltransferase-1
MQLAVFASGSGSNFKAILDAVAGGHLPANIRLLVCNKPGIGAIAHAEAAGIPVAVLNPAAFTDQAAYVTALLARLHEQNVDFIALAGYLKKIPLPVVQAFRGRMVNIHPALLPKFGGPGMYGLHVHRAVLAAGEAVSGATVHLVEEDYDTGAIVLQREVPVLPGDTPEALAARVLAVEHQLYPEALRLLATRHQQESS